ncbi:MAG: ABC transporter ATP-binding protein [Pseudobdellovibrionaceae bacterium]
MMSFFDRKLDALSDRPPWIKPLEDLTHETSARSFSSYPLRYYIKKFPRPFFMGMLFLLITNGLDASWPYVLKIIIDQVSADMSFDQITLTCLLFFSILLGLAIFRFSWRYYFGRFHSTVAEHLRRKVFIHLTTLGPSFFQKNPVGELMSLLTNDVQAFRQAVGPGLLILADGVIIILFVFPIMLSLNWVWTLKTLIFLPLIPFLIWWVMKRIHRNYNLQQQNFSEMTGMCQETVNGIRVIKGFAQEEQRMKVFDEISNAFEKSCNRVAKVDSFFMPVMEFGVASGSVILLFLASDDLLSGAVSIGTFVAFQRYIQKMVWPVTALGMGLSWIQKGYTSQKRLSQILETKTDVIDDGKIELTKFDSLEFKNVTFNYSGSDQVALKNISFRLEKNQHLGIIGKIGSGKTTLVNLILRLYPTDSGKICINDLPVENYTLESLRRIFALVPQEAYLFSESVAENIFFANRENYDQNPMKFSPNNYLDIVNMQNEINQLPQKEKSQLGERGINLSGGQKQRLTIARGLATEAKVFILDDSLSAVDTKTEVQIENALYGNNSGTVITIAHRLSSIKNTTHMLVMNEGAVEYFGTTGQAVESPTYQEIQKLQNHEIHSKPESALS